MKEKLILEEIQVAKSSVAEAENDLSRLLKEIEIAPRAEKTTVSAALHEAFLKLRDAREHLGKLDTLIRSKDD